MLDLQSFNCTIWPVKGFYHHRVFIVNYSKLQKNYTHAYFMHMGVFGL